MHLTNETRVIRGRRYRIIDVNSRDCKRLNCVREAEMMSDLCHVHLASVKRSKRLRDYKVDQAA